MTSFRSGWLKSTPESMITTITLTKFLLILKVLKLKLAVDMVLTSMQWPYFTFFGFFVFFYYWKIVYKDMCFRYYVLSLPVQLWSWIFNLSSIFGGRVSFSYFIIYLMKVYLHCASNCHQNTFLYFYLRLNQLLTLSISQHGPFLGYLDVPT